MSLINQVLRDLDRRHAPVIDRAALPTTVHVAPAKRRESRLLLVATLAALVAASWYLAGKKTEPLLALLRVSLQESAPALQLQAVPQHPPEPRLRLEPPPQAVSPAEPQSAPSPPPQPRAAEADATPPDAPRPPPAPAKPKGAVVTGATRQGAAHAAKGRIAMAAVPPPIAAAPKDLPMAADPASIDKRSRTSPAHDIAETQYRRAMAALRRGATTEAVEGLHAALRADASHVLARQALLSLLVEQRQWGEAQMLIEEGLTLDPAQTGWAMALARLQLENGKLDAATETLARYARYADQNADYQAFDALLLQKQKRYREAGERYHAALALKPAESRWWYGLGLLLEEDQKPQEARDAFLKARELGNLPPVLAAAVEQHLR